MEQAEVVARHRTAIKRYDLSRPVKRLLERGLLRKGNTFFDYGCGHGMDIEGLTSMGYQAAGWDPAFRPSEPKTPASVVNLGFVLNVIERPEERVASRGRCPPCSTAMLKKLKSDRFPSMLRP